MSDIINQAKAKLAEQLKSFEGGSKEKTVSKPVADVLTNFCDDEQFASAIIESKETLSSCCKSVMSDVGSSVSDLEVYKRAAEFYFPTATVLFKMEICLNAQDEWEHKSAGKSGNKIVSLLDFI